jgi:outer membrane protein OmpA-like peptidoglycan-associated protein
VFATSAGSTASDGTGRNGLFTTHLLNNLKTSGLEVKEVFNRTGADVSRASNRQQIPAVYNQFFENAYLGARPAVNTPVQPAPAVQPAPTPAPVVQPATTHAQPPTPAVQPTVLPSTHPVRPEQQVSLTPQPFSPDGDGVDDELIININVKNNHPIRNWSIEIREPESPYLLFYEWKGEGNPPSTLIWNGKKTSGELVQSATKYSFVLTVTDTQNKISKFNESVEVDVMVHREGNLLRVIVPSIIFASNTGDFKKLTEEQMKHNDRILWRIAEVLGRFDTYKVTVEGHANPTTAPGTRARTTEETGTNREIGLRSLSQQRAQTVVNYLADLGIDRSRLTPMGVGSSRTVVEFTDKDNWWKNRRVEFVLVK